MHSWYTVEPTHPGSLVEARLQAHHAAQVASAAAATLLEPREDHSDRNLAWSARLGSLVGRAVGPLQAGLRVADLAWVVVHEGTIVASWHATGHSLAQGLGFLRTAWREHGGGDHAFVLPGYELPDHAVARGGLFGGAEANDLHRLAAWFSNAHQAVGFEAERSGAGPVRVWPHHFDLAALRVLAGEGESVRSIGIGFSPGDGGIDQPYFYVTPWPYPPADALPALGAGRWNTAGWTGAVLQGDQGAHDEEVVASFLHEAVHACGEALSRA